MIFKFSANGLHYTLYVPTVKCYALDYVSLNYTYSFTPEEKSIYSIPKYRTFFSIYISLIATIFCPFRGICCDSQVPRLSLRKLARGGYYIFCGGRPKGHNVKMVCLLDIVWVNRADLLLNTGVRVSIKCIKAKKAQKKSVKTNNIHVALVVLIKTPEVR